jgi:hypothetical protein
MSQNLILKKLQVKTILNNEQTRTHGIRKNYDLEYYLGDLKLNDLLGREITIAATGHKECLYCQRVIKKTFNQGYCFPCSQKLARCDLCILKPERCHYFKGTCREPAWGEEHCLIPHSLYIANSSGLKIGITREFQRLTRWADQGAVTALALFSLTNRLASGKLEEQLSKQINDKTNWRHLLTGTVTEIDLEATRIEILKIIPDEYQQFLIEESKLEEVNLNYPIKSYLAKAQSHNLDKTPSIAGELLGIRGQYLLIGAGGLNVRNFQGYEVRISY